MHFVSGYLFKRIAKQVDENCLVAWYAPAGQQRTVASSLTVPKRGRRSAGRYEWSSIGKQLRERGLVTR
jgi:hypothetical protein